MKRQGGVRKGVRGGVAAFNRCGDGWMNDTVDGPAFTNIIWLAFAN